MRKVIVTIGLIVCALYPVSIAVFFGGLLFGGNVEPYMIWFGLHGVYAIGYILGLVTDDVLSEEE